MEQNVKFLENFLKELNRYCDSSAQTDSWYANMQKRLADEQEEKRIRNDDSYREQQNSLKAVQEKYMRERDEMVGRIRRQIFQKTELIRKGIEENCRIRDRILHKKEEIVRPEFFEFAYRYQEYGDFYPEITRLEQYGELPLDQMIARINDNRTSLIVNRIKALLKSEDMMIEYAAFSNLIGKARYLCEMDNDALREKGNEEIRQLELEMESTEERFMKIAARSSEKRKQIEKENEEYRKMFEQACEAEIRHLREDYQNRQLKNYDSLRSLLKEKYPASEMKRIYRAFEDAENQQKKYICADGVPLPAKLGQLWFAGNETLKNDYIRQLLEKDYDFMIQEGRLSIPGIA